MSTTPALDHLPRARAASAASQRTERIRRLIETAPPLTAEQKRRLQALVSTVPTLGDEPTNP